MLFASSLFILIIDTNLFLYYETNLRIQKGAKYQKGKNMRILGIVPYHGLKETILSITKNMADIDCDIFVLPEVNYISLYDSFETYYPYICKKIMSGNYDIILTRGGITNAVQRYSDIPVITIPFSAYDMLQVIHLAQNLSNRFAIVGFDRITNVARLICDLLQYHIDIYTIKRADEMSSVLSQLKSQGYSLVVGSSLTTHVAHQLNLESLLVTSSPTSVSLALDQASSIYLYSRRRKREAELRENIIANSPYQPFLLDPDGSILYCPPTYTDNQVLQNCIKKQLSAVIAQQKAVLTKIIHGTLYQITGTYLSDQGLAIFYVMEGSSNLSVKYPAVVCRDSGDIALPAIFLHLNSLESPPLWLCQLQKCAVSDDPVIIIGEAGTGKYSAACLIYKNCGRSFAPLREIDFAKMNDKAWNYLLRSTESPLNYSGLTIIFRNTQCISSKYSSEFMEYMFHSTLHLRCKLVFLYTPNHSSDVSRELLDILRYDCNAASVMLPTLNEQVSSMERIVSVFLGELTTTTSSPAVGFHPEAMECLKRHNWTNNYHQLSAVLKQLVSLSPIPYISKELTQQVLRGYESMPKELPVSSLNLNQTLDDITKDIIRQVLEEEHGSHIKAAKRLGIHRVTLWRKINDSQGEE